MTLEPGDWKKVANKRMWKKGMMNEAKYED
jgi:hypothetical protein